MTAAGERDPHPPPGAPTGTAAPDPGAPTGTAAPGHRVVVAVDRMAAGGDALGRLPDGRVVFVEGALPGEVVEAVVTEARRDFARARTETVRTASPARTVGPCPHHRAGCGGCPWQDVDPGAQVALKEGVVIDALRRIARTEPAAVLPAVRGPAAGYRTTLHVGVAAGGRPGFRRRHAHEVVGVDSCLVAHPRLAELLPDLRLPAGTGVTLRTGTADGARLAVTTGRPRRAPRPGGSGRAEREPGDRRSRERAEPEPGDRDRPTGLPGDVAVIGPGQDGAVHETAGGRRWRISARSFFQSGPAAADAIAAGVGAALADGLGPGDRLVDLYGGVGLLGGVVAGRHGCRLVCVESDRSAAADARVNLADLPAEVVRAEVGRWQPAPADAVIADPARTGLGRPGVDAVVATGAARVVLVSCDPASGARDTRLLAERGYRLVSLQLIDAFAHTFHTEVVCAYRKASLSGGD